MTAAGIAARAVAEIGTPFRLHGRMKGVALDCVGLVGVAIAPHLGGLMVPSAYRMRGDYCAQVERFFSALPFCAIAREEWAADGDVLLVRPSPSQLHLMIHARNGWVHAHAGLRRIVHTPVALDWPVITGWRLIGG